jgi:hypothetical protein
MTPLTEQVDDGPVIVSLLKVRQLQTDQLCTPQTAAEQECQDGKAEVLSILAFRAYPVNRGGPYIPRTPFQGIGDEGY